MNIYNNQYKKYTKEDFFVAYAVNGPIIDHSGLRAGLPVRHPISGPVNEPSPLNSQYLFNCKKCNLNG